MSITEIAKPKPQPEYLTAKEVAELLRMDVRTVIKLAQKYKIGKKFGKQWRFKREEIDNYKGDNND